MEENTTVKKKETIMAENRTLDLRSTSQNFSFLRSSSQQTTYLLI